MTDVPGRRKALVLFSEGIDYDIYDVFNNKSATDLMDDARDAIAAAQRANVSIYAVDPRGLTQLGDEAITVGSLPDDPNVDYGTSRGFQRELLLAQESLISLAEETGGLADRAHQRYRRRPRRGSCAITAITTCWDTRRTSKRAPGKFRKIEVRVKRPGRHGPRATRLRAGRPEGGGKKRETEVKPALHRRSSRR